MESRHAAATFHAPDTSEFDSHVVIEEEDRGRSRGYASGEESKGRDREDEEWEDSKGRNGKVRDNATAITSMLTPRGTKVGGEGKNLRQPKEIHRGNVSTSLLVGREDL